MYDIVNGITVPYLLGIIGLFVLLSLTKIYSNWRQVKRSPYFFLRQQAEKRLQAYLWATVGLFVLAGSTATFAWQTPPDTTIRMALLANSKPVSVAERERTVDDIPVIDLDSPESVEINPRVPLTESSISVSMPLEGLPGALGESVLEEEPTLPEEFAQFEATAELSPDTELTPLVFSLEVNDDYDPVSPRRVFAEGFFTIYATFDYVEMADGMEWAWIWRRDGEIVSGGNELWDYGDDGPGWIYYEPPEGFSPGEYTLEVWVNGELFQQASLSVENEAANR